MHAVSAKKGNDRLYTGDFAKDVMTNQVGRITNFLQDYEGDIMYAQLNMFEAMGPNRLIITQQTKYVELDQLDGIVVNQGTGFYYYDEEKIELKMLPSADKAQLLQPNLHKANQHTVQCFPVNLFFDDTSANKSKKWNALHCIQLQMAGLPVDARQQSNNIKFVSASNEVAMMEMISAVVEDLQCTKCHGVKSFDAIDHKEIVVTTEVALCVCDFAMMAEASNHMGANTNKFCPRCKVDRSESLVQGDERTPVQTKRILQRLALNPNNKELKQQHGLKHYQNALWDVINPHCDIPVSLLHWMYLGLAKHLLKSCMNSLNKDKVLVSLLDSMDQSSFKEKLSNQVIGYIDSRQGKDIKHYIQIAPYHMKIAGLQRNKVNLICRLAEICRYIEVYTMYTVEDVSLLKEMLNTYITLSSRIFPELLNKVKTHMSTHVGDDILRHGPPSSYIEDAFEKMHGFIRQQIFNQNQHARSRYTASAFAEQEVLKHVISGGYFLQQEEWTQASENVQKLAKIPTIQKYLGSSGSNNTERKELGVCCKADRTAKKKIVWKEVTAETNHVVELATQLFKRCNSEPTSLATFQAVRCQNGDVVKTSNPVLYMDTNEESIGIFVGGYEAKGCPGAHVAKIQLVQEILGDDQDISAKYSSRPRFIYLSSKLVLQSICLVHDCLGGGCHLREGNVTLKKEQQDVTVAKTYWHHNLNHTIFFLNKFRFTHSKTKY
ncbi:uncharacterized protein LOC117342414 isoform X2 [Pecten maximus]|nr:uncharacterized protein LOC117342414 isoform X2 [Pecten maximus]